jgi:two-component system, LuxR family, response regulator FixJ
MPDETTVYIVDDDPDARDSVQALVSSMGIREESFPSAEEFLESYCAGAPGCLVTDVRMLGMSGLELQDELKKRSIFLPVIVLTAYARTATTIRAVKAGAVTLIEKPYEEDELWDAIRRALAEDCRNRARHEYLNEIRLRLAELTAAERRVMDLVVEGIPNKAIAARLDVSLRTVEAQRQAVFRKMEVDSVAALVKQVVQADPEQDS